MAQALPQQLDIFEHGRPLMLLNDTAAALLSGDAVAAARAVTSMADEFPAEPALSAARHLLQNLASTASQPDFTDTAAALAAVHALHGVLAPAAFTLFGHGAAPRWVADRWAALAARASALPYAPKADANTVMAAAGGAPEPHAAALWLRAGHWRAAAAAAATIPSWRRIPVSLAWMAQARWHAQGPDAAWPLLCELAWLAPTGLAEVAQAIDSPLLDKALRRFGAGFDGDGSAGELAWFPAWTLADQPTLAEPFSLACPSRQTEPEQAFMSVAALLRLERQGRHADVVAERRRLRALHAGLFAGYMKTR